MAINPSTKYPGQTIPGVTGFPYGSARNGAVAGDGAGTPLEKDLVNDIFGFQQALLVAAGIVPSGVPDQVGASQYLQAIQFQATAAAELVRAKIPGASDATVQVDVNHLRPGLGSTTLWTSDLAGYLKSGAVPGVDPPASAIFLLQLPRQSVAKIRTIAFTMIGGSGHGALPQFRPKLELFRNNNITAASDLIATATDASGSVAAYEALHGVQATLGSAAAVGGHTWILKLSAESGTNAATGLQVTQIAVLVSA